MTIGERIKERRIELGMTQEELALKLGYKSRSSVNKVELSSDVTLKTIRAYAKALDVDAAYLMGWDGQPQGNLSYIDTSAVADLMLNPTNKELITIINKMRPEEKRELLDYATFLIKKRG